MIDRHRYHIGLLRRYGTHRAFDADTDFTAAAKLGDYFGERVLENISSLYRTQVFKTCPDLRTSHPDHGLPQSSLVRWVRFVEIWCESFFDLIHVFEREAFAQEAVERTLSTFASLDSRGQSIS